MNPRGDRLACSLRTLDRCQGKFSVFPGHHPGSVGKIEPVIWNQPGKRDVVEATFILYAGLSMTGRIITLNQHQWRALVHAKLETFFYSAILWGKDPNKVVDDGEIILRRVRPDRPATTPPATIVAQQISLP